MGLMKFLAVGRSLGRINDQPSPFKMTQQTLLPKFGAGKKVEVVPTVSEPVPDANASLKEAAVMNTPSTDTKANSAANSQKVMNTVAVENPAAGSAAQASPRQAFPTGRWTFFKNPFSRPPKPRASEGPQQCELRLDAVKPVRNDLNDSDLELIPKTTVAGSSPAVVAPRVETVAATVVPSPQAAAEVHPKAPDLAWGRVSRETFGAGKI